jgi:predicted 3-demethylubiquinone-9 3-methyltransferase (glyoxalase superfamily)
MTTIPNPLTICLWFDDQAEDAARFYTSVFSDAETGRVSRYGKEGFEYHQKPEGSTLSVDFKLSGQQFIALNGGPIFKINPSISIFANCGSQEETEAVWAKLLPGAKILMPLDKYDWSEKYGWLEDKFGLSWQIMTGTKDDTKQKFTPCLMFVNDQVGRAEEAIKHYTSIFPDSEIRGILKYGPDGHDREDYVKHAQFSLNGYELMAMDSGLEHEFGFNEAISFVITCQDQEEVDFYWQNLTHQGQESQCGWLKDKFGVSWQVVPKVLQEMLADNDPEKTERVTKAFFPMKKLEIDPLIKAYEGKTEAL